MTDWPIVIWLYLLSALLEVGGLVAVGVGIRQRWRHHDYQIDNLRERVLAVLMARPDPPRPEPVAAKVKVSHGLELGMQIRAVVQQPLMLPDPVADPVGFADEVRDQLEKAHRDVIDLRMQLDEQRNRQDAAVAQAQELLQSEVQKLRGEGRAGTILGYGWDFIGWLLLILGVTLGAVATGVIYFTT